MNNLKKIYIVSMLPFLMGAKPIDVIIDAPTNDGSVLINPSTYRTSLNGIDYFIVGAVRQNIPIEFHYGISYKSSIRMELTVDYKDKDGNLTRVYSKSNRSTGMSDSFTYTLSTTNFSYNSWGGPLFIANLRMGLLTSSLELKPKFLTPNDNKFNLASLDDYHASMSSEPVIYVYQAKNGESYEKEDFKFANSLSLDIDLGRDNCLDLEFPILSYSRRIFSSDALITNPVSMIIDYYDMFPYVATSKVLSLPGSFVIGKESTIRFHTTPTFYVDPQTRYLYPNSNDGILTKKLYFPYDAYSKDDLTDSLNTILFYSFYTGLSKIYFIAQFNISVNPYGIIGNCYSSEYCVTALNGESDI